MDKGKNVKGYKFILIVCVTILLFFICFINFMVYAHASDEIEIILTGKTKTAYTNEDGTEAYVYYDVIDQHGNSVRTSFDVNWTAGGASVVDVNKSSGRITIKKDKDSEEAFTYGTNIYLVGVNAKSGKSLSDVVSIGMAQAIDEVVMAGFVNIKGDKKKVEESLPLDFPKNTWCLLYVAKDQNGNICNPEKYDPEKITFITDQPLLVENVSSAGGLYTIDGIEYASIIVNPGQNAKQGGKVGFSVISNKTGTKTTKTFTIGGTGSQDSDNSGNYNPDNTQDTDDNNNPDNSYDLDDHSNNTNISISPILKQEQKIQAKSVTKEYGCGSFYLNAVTSGNGMLAYSSNNKEVASVDNTGKVSVTGYGETIIIIRAQETNEYKSAVRKITITVIPKAVSIKKAVSPSRGEIQYEWKKHKTISGYEIYIDTNKNFKMKQSTSITKDRVSLKINNALSGKTYYMKIRAYKNIGKKKYYGKWSKVKKVKVK